MATRGSCSSDSVIARSGPRQGLPAMGQEAGLTRSWPLSPHTPATPSHPPRHCCLGLRPASAVLGRREATRLTWPCQHQVHVHLLGGPASSGDSHTGLGVCVPATSPTSLATGAGGLSLTPAFIGAARVLLQENERMFLQLPTDKTAVETRERLCFSSARETSSLTSKPHGHRGPALSLARSEMLRRPGQPPPR